MADTPTRDAYLEAALQLIDEHGAAAQTLGLTVARICELTGLHRSTVYRKYPTVTGLNDQIATWLAVGASDWRIDLTARPPSEDLRAAIATALPDPSTDCGVWARGLVAAWDAHHPARQVLVEVEAARQARLGAWISCALAHRGHRLRPGVSAEVAALGVASLVEGRGLAFHLDPHQPDSADQGRALVIDRVTDLLEALSEPGEADLPADLLADHPEVEPPLDRFVVDHLDVDALLDHRPPAGRLVHMGRLARRLGITERRLYARWPTAEDMNVAIVRAVMIQERDRLDDLLARVIDAGSAPGAGRFDQLVASCCQSAVALPSQRRCNYFAAMRPFWRPEQRAPFDDLLESWLASIRTAFLATHALLRVRRRPEIAARDFTSAIRDSFMGLQRLALVNPELLDLEMDNGRGAVPAAGWLPLCIGQTMTERSDEPDWLDRMSEVTPTG